MLYTYGRSAVWLALKTDVLWLEMQVELLRSTLLRRQTREDRVCHLGSNDCRRMHLYSSSHTGMAFSRVHDRTTLHFPINKRPFCRFVPFSSHLLALGRSGGKSKGKSKASKARDLEVFGLDSLLSEATYEAKRAEITNEVLANKEDLDAILNRTFDIAKEKAKTEQTEAQDRSNNLTIMGDSFIKIPGVIRVLCPQSGTPTDVRFSFPCPKDQLKALYESLRLVADDEADLEEVLRSGLVPWVRQKLGGQAPSDVCLWLLRVVMGHESSAVVLAAEEALMELLEESRWEWKMEYQDVLHIWRRCGAVWLVEGRGATEDMRDEEGMADEGDMSCCLRRNLRPALNVICGCMRKGAHDFSSDDLQELMLDLAAVSLDKGVSSSCMTELYTTMVAVADAIPSGLFDDAQKFSSLVDALCNLSARAVEKLVEPVSFVLLAHNVPYYCSGNTIGEDGQGLSLRHEVCHRLLSRRFLCNTSYVGDDSPKGFERALKALHVLFDNEDNLLQDSSEEGYQCQYAIVALANEMAAGTLVVSQSGKPDAVQSKSMIAAVDKIYGKLINTMQPCVQMSKTILNSMKNIYAPYVATSTGRQGKLSFASSAFEEESCGDSGDSSGSDVEIGDYDDEEESEESLDMGEVDDDDNDVEMVETAPN